MVTLAELWPSTDDIVGWGVPPESMLLAAEWRRPRVPWCLPAVSTPASANARVTVPREAWGGPVAWYGAHAVTKTRSPSTSGRSHLTWSATASQTSSGMRGAFATCVLRRTNGAALARQSMSDSLRASVSPARMPRTDASSIIARSRLGRSERGEAPRHRRHLGRRARGWHGRVLVAWDMGDCRGNLGTARPDPCREAREVACDAGPGRAGLWRAVRDRLREDADGAGVELFRARGAAALAEVAGAAGVALPRGAPGPRPPGPAAWARQAASKPAGTTNRRPASLSGGSPVSPMDRRSRTRLLSSPRHLVASAFATATSSMSRRPASWPWPPMPSSSHHDINLFHAAPWWAMVDRA